MDSKLQGTQLEKSWKDFKCHIIIQCMAIGLLTISLICAMNAWNHDEKWVEELDRMRDIIFTNTKENELLTRNYPGLLEAYIISLGIGLLAIIAHLLLCIQFGNKHFTVGKVSRILTFIIGFGLILSIIPAICQVLIYQSQYHKLYDIDKRNYYYATENQNGEPVYEQIQPFFYYCVWGNGRPVDWGKIKGLRLKKTQTAICQKSGMKIISFLITVYAAVIYLTMNLKITTPKRDLEAQNMVFLYELFGDYELAESGPRDGKEDLEFQNYKEGLVSKTENMPLPQNLKDWLEGKNLRDSKAKDGMKYDVPTIESYLELKKDG